MDVFVAVLIFLGVICITVSFCLLGCWCYLIVFKIVKRDENNPEAPVVVTTTTTTANPPVNYPVSVQATPAGGYQATPYPTQMPMPMPMPATGAGNQPYPTHPGPMPMPMPQTTPYPGYYPNPTPYPPAAGPAASQANPPSYDQVVSSDTYVKQSPYNPNYSNSGY